MGDRTKAGELLLYHRLGVLIWKLVGLVITHKSLLLWGKGPHTHVFDVQPILLVKAIGVFDLGPVGR